MNLSTHFTYEEMIFSESALRQGLDNKPNSDAMINLQDVCETLLEPIRSLLNVPLHINSGYRSPTVNRLVGGAADSRHLQGLAADFVPIGFNLKDAFDAVRLSKIPFDQCIYECQAWIHVGLAPFGQLARRQVLTAKGMPGHWSYEVVA